MVTLLLMLGRISAQFGNCETVTSFARPSPLALG